MKTIRLDCAVLVWLAAGMLLAQPPARVNLVGAVESVDAASGQITMHTDNGKTVKITPHPTARLFRLPAGEKSLAKAVPITMQAIVPGDRLLARGELSADGAAMTASTLVIMTKADVAKVQQADRAEWARRGVGGIVSAVDPQAGQVTIITRTFEGKKPLVIQVSPKTQIRRYAPDSVKFADAKPSSLAEIKIGDQVRALGTRSEDGSHYAAEEVVSGSFRNLAATVIKVDDAADTLTVKDLVTKKPVLVHVNADTTLRKLPEMLARIIAVRMVGGAPGAGGPGGGGGNWSGGQRPAGAPPGGPPGAGGTHGSRNGDFQQLLERMPAMKLEDLKPGEAVIVSSTQGQDPGQVTAIMLVAGVEPILSAAPGGSQRAAMLGSWNLDMSAGMGVE